MAKKTKRDKQEEREEAARISIDFETNLLYDLCICTELESNGESERPEDHDNHCG